MKRHHFPLLLALICATTVDAHLFTDSQGRQVEAEVVGLRGANVVLAVQSVRGQWPLDHLSPPDQAYVREWQTTHTAVKQVTVWVNEKDGIGEKGEFAKNNQASPASPLKDLPIAPPTQTKTSFKHYLISTTNPATVDASYLKVAYVIYVIKEDGSIGISPGVQTIPALAPGKSQEITSEGVTATRTKATKLKLSLSKNAVGVNEKTVRSKEEFGGIWVRVSGPDGTQIGECRQLTQTLQKLDPPWEEAEVREDIPVLNSLQELLELLKKALPPPPAGGDKPKAPGPLPFP